MVAPWSGCPWPQTRPPWRSTIRWTVASPIPVPSNSDTACKHRKATNSWSASLGSKPAPLSLTKKTASSLDPRIPSRSGVRTLFGELPRVAEQVGQNDSQQIAIRLGLHPSRDDHLDLAGALPELELRGHLFGQRCHIHYLGANLRAASARQQQQVVDQITDAACRDPQMLQQRPTVVVQAILVVLQEHAAGPVDMAHGGPKVVGDRVAEGLELTIGRLELDGSFLDTALELPLALGQSPNACQVAGSQAQKKDRARDQAEEPGWDHGQSGDA